MWVIWGTSARDSYRFLSVPCLAVPVWCSAGSEQTSVPHQSQPDERGLVPVRTGADSEATTAGSPALELAPVPSSVDMAMPVAGRPGTTWRPSWKQLSRVLSLMVSQGILRTALSTALSVLNSTCPPLLLEGEATFASPFFCSHTAEWQQSCSPAAVARSQLV